MGWFHVDMKVPGGACSASLMRVLTFFEKCRPRYCKLPGNSTFAIRKLIDYQLFSIIYLYSAGLYIPAGTRTVQESEQIPFSCDIDDYQIYVLQRMLPSNFALM